MSVHRTTRRRRIQKAVQASLTLIQTQSKIFDSSECASDFEIGELVNEQNRDSTSNQGTSLLQALANDFDSSCTGIKYEVKRWALKHNITHLALNELLIIFRSFFPECDFPKDSRTLLRTPRNAKLTDIQGGQIYHFGIKQPILQTIDLGLVDFRLPKLVYFEDIPNLITLTVGIDGLPLSKSSRKQFWPVLFYVDQSISKEVFPASIYYGEEMKPQSVSEFLRSFIEELKELERGFSYKDVFYKVRIRCIIADAPARSFIKCIKGHNGFYGCERCNRKGKHKNGRMLYRYEENETLHTDYSFSNRLCEKHHNEHVLSPLLELKLGLISQVPIDYMHLCCLGVMKKLLLLWKEGPLPHKIRPRQAAKISSRLQKLSHCIPKDFVRKTRTLNDLRNWKATEFRTFMLYAGPVALKDLIDNQKFDHFMKFHTAMYLLISIAAFKEEWINIARCLLDSFNKDFSELYDKNCMIYNVHMLKHLHLDALIHGPLDRISAFPFENSMQPIKRLLRKKNCHLKQLVNRLVERNHLYLPEIPNSRVKCVNKHEKDNCYLTSDLRVCLLVEIVSEGQCYVKCYGVQEDVAFYPIKSSKLGIYFVDEIQERQVLALSQLTKKCFRIPYSNGYICIPLCAS